MSDKVQLIKQEVKRRISQFEAKYPKDLGGYWNDEESAAYDCAEEYKRLLQFIDSLPEEPVSKDLDEELRKILNEHYYFPDEDDELRSIPDLAKYIAYHFAEWQENKNAVQSCKNLYSAIKENQEKKIFNDDFEKASYAQGMIDGSMWYKQQMKEALQTEYEKGRFDIAQWKDEQFDEEKKELLGLVNMLPIDETNQTIIEDLKELLK